MRRLGAAFDRPIRIESGGKPPHSKATRPTGGQSPTGAVLGYVLSVDTGTGDSILRVE